MFFNLIGKNFVFQRRTVRDFIQDDVEVDDDEDDETDVDYNEGDNFVDPSERREAERAIREQESIGQDKRRRNKFADMSEEEMAKYFEARHAQESSENRTSHDDTYDDISQNSLLPTTRDPNLWIIKVRMGEEKIVTLQLLRKCIARTNAGDVSEIDKSYFSSLLATANQFHYL